MPNSNEILNEIRAAGSTHDVIRRRYLQRLHHLTGRNIIAYYSGWLQRQEVRGTPVTITDSDMNGFMTVLHQLDRSIGLDLILHTPGGEISATESLVDYLRSMFGTNIRAFVPQLAMSAGTMIACACKEIYMGKHSNLGPIDPQIHGIPAHGILADFERAHNEVQQDRSKILVWQPILTKYQPGDFDQCHNAIELTQQIVAEWLSTGMFKSSSTSTAKQKSKDVVSRLSSADFKTHSRHLSVDKCKQIGLNICYLENDKDLQDTLLSVHHAFIQTFGATTAVKIIENHNGIASIDSVARRG